MIPSGDKYRAIPLSEAVASAKEELRLTTTEHDSFLTRLANQALVSMSTSSTSVKSVCTLDIVDGRAELPCGFVRFVSAVFIDHDVPVGPIYADIAFYGQCGLNEQVQPMKDGFQIINGFLVMNNPQVPENISIKIAYFGRNVDEDGLMVMTDRQERAIIAYICYKFSRAYFERFPYEIRTDFKNEWAAQRAYITGMDTYEGFREDIKAISSIIKAWGNSNVNEIIGDR